jgi:hypothetical protein
MKQREAVAAPVNAMKNSQWPEVSTLAKPLWNGIASKSDQHLHPGYHDPQPLQEFG